MKRFFIKHKLSRQFSNFIAFVLFAVVLIVGVINFFIFKKVADSFHERALASEARYVEAQLISYLDSQKELLDHIALDLSLIELIEMNAGLANFSNYVKSTGLKNLTIYDIEGKKLYGKMNWHSHYVDIVKGEKDSDIGLALHNGENSFHIALPIKKKNKVVGVIEVIRPYIHQEIFKDSTSLDYQINYGGMKIFHSSGNSFDKIFKKIKLTPEIELTIFELKHNLFKQFLPVLITLSLISLVLYGLFWVYFKRKGIERFVLPHLELQEMTHKINEVMAMKDAMMDSAKYLFIVTDSDGVIKQVNKRTVDITGYSEEELLSNFKIDALISEKSLEDRAQLLSEIKGYYFEASFEVLVHNVRSGEIEDREINLVTRSDKEIPLQFSISSFKNEDDSLKGFFVVAEDITFIKKTEAVRKKAIEEIKRTAELKTSFLANMSHEIRTPIHGIMGMSELLSQSKLTKEQEEINKMILSSSDTLLYLVNDILDLSKLDSQKITMENREFSLADSIKEVQMSFDNIAKSKEVTLIVDSHIEDNLIVNGDEFRIKQVLNNLLSNAIKFTDKGQVSLKVEYTEDGFNFVVEDTGIGINSESLKNVFSPFEQADASITRKYGGTGLGLAITKSLVELMGGVIFITSEPGVGTKISFTLKLEHHLNQETLSKTSQDVDLQCSSNYRILIAEDNLINQKILSKMLEKLGVETVVVENGQEAFDIIQKEKFDLIFMDMQMPILDGISATVKIREYEKDKVLVPIKIVALTANAFLEDKNSCLDAGMDYYLSKPVKRDDIIKVINKACAEKKTA